MRNEYFTTLTDADGDVHKYELVQHPATEGLRLFQRLLEAVAHPAGALIASFQASGSLPEDFSATSVMSYMLDDGLDAELVGKAADLFVAKLGANMDLFSAVLKYTERDGAPLRNEFDFDSAYQGNYLELFAVVSWAVKVNFSSMLGAHKFPFAPGGRSARKANGD